MDEILNAGKEDIRQLAPYIESMIGDDHICVLGGEEIIEREKELFDTTESLF